MVKRTLLFLSFLTLFLPLLAACGNQQQQQQQTSQGANTVLNATGGIVTVFTRNFNPFNGNPLYPTIAGIYEPLMIYNTTKGELTPWLASSYQWSSDNKALTLVLHDGVKWSDGQALTADDVAFTFNLFKKYPGLQGSGLTAMTGDNVTSITTPDAQTVVFHFSRVFSPALYDIVKQNIVPQHIWKDVANPVTYTNDNPVGSGPFTQVATFQNQVYEVDKNPYYWQSGKPAYKGIRVQAYSSNDQETLALDNGQVDWAGNFIPNIKQALIDKNPNMHYWSPTTGLVALMELNTTKKPYNDVNMRKAISMALDRQHMVDVAISGYTKPADVTGLSDGFAKWKVSDLSQLGDWTTYNVAKANQLLDSAGYKKGADGYRTFPDGSPMTLNLTMVNGFSDWISAGNIMVPNLKAVGLNVQVKTINPSVLFDIEPKGQFDMALWFGFQTATPFTFYQNVMSKATVVPVGQVTFTNFGRYSSAAADALLDQFASTTDASRQLQLGYQLQKVFADEAPVIPLWPAPDYCEYSTAHFTGWPSADNPYATCQPQGNTSPQQLIVLTTIKPV